MSCFGCCEEDDFHKAADNGGQYMVKNSAGNPVVDIHIEADKIAYNIFVNLA